MSQFIFPPLSASLDSEQTSGGSLPSKQMITGGYHAGGSKVYPIAVDADGQLQVDVVSSTGPTGFATSALQTAGNNILTTIDVDTSALFNCVDAGGSQMQVDIVADGAGLATSAKQDTIETTLTAIETDVDTSAGAVSAIQSAQGTTDTGIPALVVRNDTLADLSGADGDYAPIQVNDTGAVYTVLSAGTAAFGKLSANSGVDIGDVDVLSLPALPAGTNTIGNVNINAIAPVDFLDSGVVDSSTANIISTGTTGTVVVSTLAAACTEIEIQEDIGEFMSMRVGGAVKAYLPLGGGRVKVTLAATDAVALFSETGTAISSGKIAINFLG